MANGRFVLTLAVFAALLSSRQGLSQKFFPDDPIQVMPPPVPVTNVANRSVNPLYDFFLNSSKPDQRPPTAGSAVNTLGEAPDSVWFTNRHGRVRMSRERLQRGAGADKAPAPPYTVLGGKNEGIAPGFRMRDSAGRLYIVKLDPLNNPEMASGAELVVSKFLYAAGYNTPENYITYAKLSDFHLSKRARMNVSDSQSRKITWRDFRDIVQNTPRSPDGSFRMMASLKIEGEAVGPFRYEGTRPDDPNDTVPHENRRDLRGLFVLTSWLNHTDAKANNSLDTIVEENGKRFIRHYLIDFGSSLGSDTVLAKDPQFGREFAWPRLGFLLTRIVTLGLAPASWERARFPRAPAAGNFEAALFEPGDWKSNYPNPAFLSRLPDDEFWAAKIVMTFSDDDIRAITETGRFTDPRVAGIITAALIERRNRIGKHYFSKVLPLDRFRIHNRELQSDDLAGDYGFRPAVDQMFQWSRFDNMSLQQHSLPGSASNKIPDEADGAPVGAYFSVVIHQTNEGPKAVTVTIRKTQNGYDVVGVERAW